MTKGLKVKSELERIAKNLRQQGVSVDVVRINMSTFLDEQKRKHIGENS